MDLRQVDVRVKELDTEHITIDFMTQLTDRERKNKNYARLQSGFTMTKKLGHFTSGVFADFKQYAVNRVITSLIRSRDQMLTSRTLYKLLYAVDHVGERVEDVSNTRDPESGVIFFKVFFQTASMFKTSGVIAEGYVFINYNDTDPRHKTVFMVDESSGLTQTSTTTLDVLFEKYHKVSTSTDNFYIQWVPDVMVSDYVRMVGCHADPSHGTEWMQQPPGRIKNIKPFLAESKKLHLGLGLVVNNQRQLKIGRRQSDDPHSNRLSKKSRHEEDIVSDDDPDADDDDGIDIDVLNI